MKTKTITFDRLELELLEEILLHKVWELKHEELAPSPQYLRRVEKLTLKVGGPVHLVYGLAGVKSSVVEEE